MLIVGFVLTATLPVILLILVYLGIVFLKIKDVRKTAGTTLAAVAVFATTVGVATWYYFTWPEYAFIMAIWHGFIAWCMMGAFNAIAVD